MKLPEFDLELESDARWAELDRRYPEIAESRTEDLTSIHKAITEKHGPDGDSRPLTEGPVAVRKVRLEVDPRITQALDENRQTINYEDLAHEALQHGFGQGLSEDRRILRACAVALAELGGFSL